MDGRMDKWVVGRMDGLKDGWMPCRLCSSQGGTSLRGQPKLVCPKPYNRGLEVTQEP